MYDHDTIEFVYIILKEYMKETACCWQEYFKLQSYESAAQDAYSQLASTALTKFKVEPPPRLTMFIDTFKCA